MITFIPKAVAKSVLKLVLWLVFMSMVLSGPTSALSADVTITDLGTLGGVTSQAFAVNNSCQVVGRSATSAGPWHAFIWQDGVMTDLGTLGGASSNAGDINDAGQVIGSSTTASGATHGFIWQDGVMTDLGTLGGSYSGAGCINELGQVGGVSTDSSGRYHCFIWENGVMTQLQELYPSNDWNPLDMNNLGQIAGYANQYAILWENGGMQMLPILPYTRVSMARKINNKGQIIGFNRSYHGYPGSWCSAVIWQNGTVTDLGNLGARNSNAWDINDSGQVVGTSATLNDGMHGFIWQDGIMTDIGPAGSGLMGINESGQVFGGAYPAFFWDDGERTDLYDIHQRKNSSSAAMDMNDNGTIVGLSYSGYGDHATMWQITPSRYFLCTDTSPAGSGTIEFLTGESPDGFYEKNSTVTLRAVPEDNYAFEGWSEDATGGEALIDIVMDSDKCVTANFVRKYLLTTSVEPAGTGAITVDPSSSDGYYIDGAVVNIAAVPEPGYAFIGWSGDIGGADPALESISVVMDSDRFVTANFAYICNEGSISTGFCGRTAKGNNANIEIHAFTGGCNASAIPSVEITRPDGIIGNYEMSPRGNGQDAWVLSYRLSTEMPEGEYRVEILLNGVIFNPSLTCTFNYEHNSSVDNRNPNGNK